MNQSILHYPESELELKDKIEQLNDKWRDFLKIQLSNEYADCIEDFFCNRWVLSLLHLSKKENPVYRS